MDTELDRKRFMKSEIAKTGRFPNFRISTFAKVSFLVSYEKRDHVLKNIIAKYGMTTHIFSEIDFNNGHKGFCLIFSCLDTTADILSFLSLCDISYVFKELPNRGYVIGLKHYISVGEQLMLKNQLIYFNSCGLKIRHFKIRWLEAFNLESYEKIANYLRNRLILFETFTRVYYTDPSVRLEDIFLLKSPPRRSDNEVESASFFEMNDFECEDSSVSDSYGNSYPSATQVGESRMGYVDNTNTVNMEGPPALAAASSAVYNTDESRATSTKRPLSPAEYHEPLSDVKRKNVDYIASDDSFEQALLAAEGMIGDSGDEAASVGNQPSAEKSPQKVKARSESVPHLNSRRCLSYSSPRDYGSENNILDDDIPLNTQADMFISQIPVQIPEEDIEDDVFIPNGQQQIDVTNSDTMERNADDAKSTPNSRTLLQPLADNLSAGTSALAGTNIDWDKAERASTSEEEEKESEMICIMSFAPNEDTAAVRAQRTAAAGRTPAVQMESNGNHPTVSAADQGNTAPIVTKLTSFSTLTNTSPITTVAHCSTISTVVSQSNQFVDDDSGPSSHLIYQDAKPFQSDGFIPLNLSPIMHTRDSISSVEDSVEDLNDNEMNEMSVDNSTTSLDYLNTAMIIEPSETVTISKMDETVTCADDCANKSPDTSDKQSDKESQKTQNLIGSDCKTYSLAGTQLKSDKKFPSLLVLAEAAVSVLRADGQFSTNIDSNSDRCMQMPVSQTQNDLHPTVRMPDNNANNSATNSEMVSPHNYDVPPCPPNTPRTPDSLSTVESIPPSTFVTQIAQISEEEMSDILSSNLELFRKN